MSAGFRDGNDVLVTPPMRVEYRFGAKRGRLVEVFSDGDAYVRFDGETGDSLVKWHHLCAVPAWAEASTTSQDGDQAETEGGER